MSLLTTLPGLINAHMHSPYGPWVRGVTRSRPFEMWMGDIMAREQVRVKTVTPDKLARAKRCGGRR
jgi:cytosine/adenosine deaminase-related metal-dependent hydrolase